MKIYLIISMLLFGHPVAHEFKMSICEISYSTENQAFEVKFYLFQDDLKEALYGNPQAPVLEPEKVKNYISQQVQISVDGIRKELQFQSFKEKNDQALVLYILPSPPPSQISNLIISNKILIENFRKQTNMVFLQMPQRSKMTLILDATKTEDIFKID